MPKLSKRLSQIAALVPNGARVCDIGTDHGYLSIELLKSGRASNVIAADIGEKPLSNARRNMENANISSMDLRLSDGFEAISETEFDTAIIVGIGGEVISGIIEKGFNKLTSSEKRLILQPTTSPEFLREFLYKSGFQITLEIPIIENDKIYSVIEASYIGKPQEKSAGFYFVGKIKPDSFEGKAYIEKQKKRCLDCIKALKNREEKAEEYLYYKSAYEDILKLTEN